MHSPRGARVGVMRLRIGEPAGAEAWRLQGGVVTGSLARLAGAAGGCVWVVGEGNAGGRQRDEGGDQGWQDDGAFHGIPLSAVTLWTRWRASTGSRYKALFVI